MASVTQTIDSYYAGMSQQPDLKKFPGQVKDIVNAIPDIVEGLHKRPGAKRIGSTPLANVQSNGSWFHYYRDETEGSYIGQIASDGKVRIWSCTDGTEQTVDYDTAGQGYNGGDSDHTSITSYLTPSSATATEDIQALTINDTTFLNNRTKTVGTTGTTDAREHSHFAYVEILRSENGRQYALNLYSNETTTNVTRATRLRKTADNLAIGEDSGSCRGIGTQVFSATSADSYNSEPLVDVENSSGSSYGASDNKKNLIFRLTVLGQNSQVKTGNQIQSDDFACTYSIRVNLLHGGEGYVVGDQVKVKMTEAKGGAAVGAYDTTKAEYTIRVEEVETVAVKSNIKAVRPAPTPFDADTAVTVDTIIGGITAQIAGTNITAQVIGNGIYLHSSSAFSVEIPQKDLMRVMQESINDVQDLPVQCKDGYIVKVANSASSSDDDYYLQFQGNDGLDGPGSWVECPTPGIVKSLDATTMPHVLKRQANGDFLVKKYSWADRDVGDDSTNPMPSFVGNKINRILFFRNRLAVLSGENVILSRPGELAVPSFFSKTALAVSSVDPIDISCSSTFPSALFDGIEVAAGLAVFSTNQQFLLSSDAEILNPDTAKLRSMTTYNYNKDLPPISLGTTVGFVDNSGKYSRFNEMANIIREQEPIVVETSKIVPTLLEKNIDLITNSRENSIVLFGKTNSDTVYAYKYFNTGEKREQQAWFKWKLNNPLKYHFIIDEDYYVLDTDNFLQKISLMQQDDDPSIDENNVNYLINLDNWTTVSGSGSYSDTTKLTTFANQSDWIDQVTIRNDSNGDPINDKLVLVDTDDDSPRIARYAECTVTNTDDFTVPGNWDWSEEHTFAHTSINTSNEQITLTTGSTDHGLKTGDPVRYIKGDTVAAGLTDGTTYYVIDKSINNIQLATSLTNANLASAVNITSQGTGTHKIQKLITDLYIGYLYEYYVSFPKFYLTRVEGDQARSDVNSSLVVHRVKLNFGKSGLYETTLERVGKDDYTEVYESTFADDYLVSDAPYVPDQIQTVPVYEANNNVNLLLKSSHPAPATLQALSWEGDYSPRNYKRV